MRRTVGRYDGRAAGSTHHSNTALRLGGGTIERLLVWSAVLAITLTAGTTTLDAQQPSEPPPPTELRPLVFPEFQEALLDNGIEIVLVENDRLPVVSISLNLKAGDRYDPAGLEGLAELVSELLIRGTDTRTADQISEQIEGVGGSLQANAGADFFSVSSTVLADHVDLAFELMGDVILNSVFPEEEIELARTRYLSTLAANKSDPGALATRFFASAVYGDHPYGRSMTEASLAAINRDDITNFAGTRLAPDGALLVVSGDVSLDRVRDLAERHFGNWQGTAPVSPANEPPGRRPTEVLLVHRPGSEQSNIFVGNLALRPTDERYYSAVVANKILGGGADARLFLILREEKGWTYGSYASVARRQDVGYFRASAEVRNEVTDSAVTEILHQLRLMRTEAVPDSEVANAKGFLVGSFPLSIQTPQQVAGQVATARLYDLGDDYIGTYRERLAAVDVAATRSGARAIMHPDSSVIVVVGDGQVVYDRLAAIAPVRIVDVDGSALTSEDLAPPTGALSIDRAHMAARRDSFQIMFQGNSIGHAVSALIQEGDSLLFWEQTVIPMMGMSQETSVTMDPATFAARVVSASGNFGGRTMETNLTYADWRVTGRAQTPEQTGDVKTVDIDTTLTDGTVDLNLIQPLLPALELEEDASFTFNAFDSGENRVRVVTLRVTGTEEVTVPAGTFSTYRVEMTGLEQAAVYYVADSMPRRLVKTELVGQPLAFELVQQP